MHCGRSAEERGLEWDGRSVGPGRGHMEVEGRRDSACARGQRPAASAAGCGAGGDSLGTASGTVSLRRGGGGKMEAGEPGSGREGGFRSVSGTSVEPGLKSWRVPFYRGT